MIKNLSGNHVSQVWQARDWVFKRQPKYLTDNEVYAYKVMFDSGYVPICVRVNLETIKTRYISTQEVTDTDEFMSHYQPLLRAMLDVGLRHGDLTECSVLVWDNKPLVIDWAESRTVDDPRPDKRREGDDFWLARTMRGLCHIT